MEAGVFSAEESNVWLISPLIFFFFFFGVIAPVNDL